MCIKWALVIISGIDRINPNILYFMLFATAFSAISSCLHLQSPNYNVIKASTETDVLSFWWRKFTGCTEGCHFYNFRWRQWRKQNDVISISVLRFQKVTVCLRWQFPIVEFIEYYSMGGGCSMGDDVPSSRPHGSYYTRPQRTTSNMYANMNLASPASQLKHKRVLWPKAAWDPFTNMDSLAFLHGYVITSIIESGMKLRIHSHASTVPLKFGNG